MGLIIKGTTPRVSFSLWFKVANLKKKQISWQCFIHVLFPHLQGSKKLIARWKGTEVERNLLDFNMSNIIFNALAFYLPTVGCKKTHINSCWLCCMLVVEHFCKIWCNKYVQIHSYIKTRPPALPMFLYWFCPPYHICRATHLSYHFEADTSISGTQQTIYFKLNLKGGCRKFSFCESKFVSHWHEVY